MATTQITQTNVVQEFTRPPFLRRVRIRGYKSISFCDVRLQPLTILVGRNAAGKSNFLDALAFLGDSIELGVAEAMKRRGGWGSVVSRTTGTPFIEIEVEAAYSGGGPAQRIQSDDSGNSTLGRGESVPNLDRHSFLALYSLQIVGGHNAPPIILRETLDLTDETDGQKGGFALQRTHSPTTVMQSRMNGGAAFDDNKVTLDWKGGNSWSSSDGNRWSISPPRSDLCLLAWVGFQPFVELSEGLRSMGFYNFHPDAIRTYQKPNPGWLLENDGHNLASVIEGLKEIDPECVRRVRDYLTKIADEVCDFDVVRYGENETVRFQVRGEDRRLEFDAASMSDGTLRALATLMAAFQIHLPSGPSVIGIEEPEGALHPAAMRALVDALDDATQRTQILLTTHSADLLSGRDITPGQVLIVRNRGGKSQITPLDKASQEIVRKELYTLADLQRMDKLDLDEADLKRQAQLSQEGGM